MKRFRIMKFVRNKINYSIFILIIMSFFLVAFNGVGQEKRSALRFNLDFAQFRMNEKTSYFEIYYSVPREDISHETIDDGYRGAFQIATKIIRDDSLFFADTLNIEDRIKSLEQISSGQKFAELSPFILTQGNYLIKSALTDLVSKNSVSITDSITID